MAAIAAMAGQQRGRQIVRQNIYTIGYGGRQFSDFLRALQAVGVQIVYDVRSIPASKHNPAFRRSELEYRLGEAGIQYEFAGIALGGIPFRGQRGLDEYMADSRVATELARIAETGGAMMCSELDPMRCHRGLLLGQTLEEQGYDVLHIHYSREGGAVWTERHRSAVYRLLYGNTWPLALMSEEEENEAVRRHWATNKPPLPDVAPCHPGSF